MLRCSCFFLSVPVIAKVDAALFKQAWIDGAKVTIIFKIADGRMVWIEKFAYETMDFICMALIPYT